MKLLKNKKGIEGMPLKYIVIALVAALVIGIALQFVGILKEGTIGAAQKYNQSVNEKVVKELDTTSPTIYATALCINDTNDINKCDKSNIAKNNPLYILANVSDNEGGSGIENYGGVYAYYYINSSNSSKGSIDMHYIGNNTYKGYFDANESGTWYAWVSAKDKNDNLKSAKTNNVTVN